MLAGARVWVTASVCSLIAFACEKDPQPTQAPAPQPELQPNGPKVVALIECLQARADTADIEDDEVRSALEGSLAALRAPSAEEAGDKLKGRFEDRDDTCRVNTLVDRCVAFANEAAVDQDEEDSALEACEERREGGGDADESSEQQAAAEQRDPVLELFEHKGFNEGKELARVIRLPRSCPNLAKPQQCGATGRMQSFENVMSSFRLEQGYTVVFYDDTLYRGKELKVPDDAARETADLSKKGFDDSASSVKIIGPDGKEL